MFTPGKILTLFALSGACCFGALWAQQEDQRPARNRGGRDRDLPPASAPIAVQGFPVPPTITYAQAGQGPNVEVNYGFATMGPRGNSPANKAFNKAIKAYREAKADSPEREQFRATVSESLSQLYDEHLANHEKQIADLEDRLVKLRDQVKRRREAKDRMVELKLEMVLSQAEGLGWPDDSNSDRLSSARYFGTTSPAEFVDTIMPEAFPDFVDPPAPPAGVTPTAAASPPARRQP